MSDFILTGVQRSLLADFISIGMEGVEMDDNTENVMTSLKEFLEYAEEPVALAASGSEAYHRYVDAFVRWAGQRMEEDSARHQA